MFLVFTSAHELQGLRFTDMFHCLAQFADASFDVAFDKGGLDALMGDESNDADTAGKLQSSSAS